MEINSTFKKIPSTTSVVAMFFSVALLFIWIFIPSLKAFSAGSMKFNTALGIFSGGLSLFLYAKVDPPKKSFKNWSGILAIVVLGIGLASLFQYVMGLDLGIDELFIRDLQTGENQNHPGRMSPIAAACLIFSGLSLSFFQASYVGLQKLSHILAYLILYITVFCMMGYLYQEKSLYQFGPYIRISWQSAFCLLITSIGILFSPTKSGITNLIASPEIGGQMTRRLLPIVILTPIFLGYIWILTRRLDLFSRELSVGLFCVIIIAVFFAMIMFVARYLNSYEQKLQKAVSVRDEFLSVASHELKTPLTSLTLQNQMFQRRLNTQETAFDLNYLRTISKSLDKQCSRLNHLINDMLDVSRMESGKFYLKKERFDLGELVTETIDEMLLTDRGFTRPVLHLGPGIVGSWDRLRLEQVVINLVNNASQYGEGKPVTVRVEQIDQKVQLIVKDQGTGIPASEFKRIFGRFERIETNSFHSGLGLGLYITHQIVVAHDGRIDIESTLGQGTAFRVTLPQLG